MAFSITSVHAGHLILDAGHISIESDLADKNILREIQAKRNQQYDEDDYRRLESMMYDKVVLRLEAAQVNPMFSTKNATFLTPSHLRQFVVGNDLQSCRDALTSENGDFLHLLERTNIELKVQSSIVPSAINLTRFKVSGKLPTLHVNISDTKYKTLMRLIDVVIPDFNGSEGNQIGDQASIGAPLSGGLFRSTGPEYNIEDPQSEPENGSSDFGDIFFEAGDGVSVCVHRLCRLFPSFDV